MSLLYECINGIIQGGILSDDASNTDEIATLCVRKLRGMISINGDPNLKYVALLAFNKIVVTHPYLVSEQEDVILDCIDNPDVTIRIQALDLFQGMVSSDNLVLIVSRLMKQLKSAASNDAAHASAPESIDSSFDSDGETRISPHPNAQDQSMPPLPEDYRLDVISRILGMASKDNYANVTDFDWYIDILSQLVRIMPTTKRNQDEDHFGGPSIASAAEQIGDELRNVAVKVHAMRSSAVHAADEIVLQLLKITPPGNTITLETLKSVVWLLGEYSVLLAHPNDTLNTLLQLTPRIGSSDILVLMIYAIAKVFSAVAADNRELWTAESKSTISLLLARVLHTIEPFSLHPDLEVQERAAEIIELLKLTAEAAAGQAASTDEASQEPPLLLTQAIPSLFNGWELNSVARGAQHHVPLPDDLDLDTPIHANLHGLLAKATLNDFQNDEVDAFELYYNERPAPTSVSSNMPAFERLADPEEPNSGSYQQPDEDAYLDPDIVERRKAKRREQERDDPFYISSSGAAPAESAIHNIIQSSNGSSVDIDSIPIMKLELDSISAPKAPVAKAAPRQRPQVTVADDEVLGASDKEQITKRLEARPKKSKQALMQLNSSALGSLNLDGEPVTAHSLQVQHDEEEEMQKAVREVEKLRLEMQRANERIQVAQGVDMAGTEVKKKKKKKATVAGEEGEKPKKMKKKTADLAADGADGDATVVVAKKKKKARAPVTFDNDAPTTSA